MRPFGHSGGSPLRPPTADGLRPPFGFLAGIFHPCPVLVLRITQGRKGRVARLDFLTLLISILRCSSSITHKSPLSSSFVEGRFMSSSSLVSVDILLSDFVISPASRLAPLGYIYLLQIAPRPWWILLGIPFGPTPRHSSSVVPPSSLVGGFIYYLTSSSLLRRDSLRSDIDSYSKTFLVITLLSGMRISRLQPHSRFARATPLVK